MLVCFAIKMLFVLVLCPVLLACGAQTLTIDSELGTSIEDCFERISIGEQLPRDAIYRNVSELTTRECEQICKQDKQCQSYDYGVGAKGNATCDLSNASEKKLKEKGLLRRNPDYDVYVRRFQCEQSPPTPIEPQFDDPSDNQDDVVPIQHRPVFRPTDEKLPFTDDYGISSDLALYGVKRPEYRPQFSDRPDDYTNPQHDYDSGPSYGGHKPQESPYRPQRPQNKPLYHSRPDPYDELQMQGLYKPFDRPGYHDKRPFRRPFVPEQLVYENTDRPKPEDTGYGFQRPDYSNPDKNSLSTRPGIYEQYSMAYEPNAPYKNNNIHVQIRDPPSYYDYRRPDQGIYGYGTYSSQNSYSQWQNSHGSQYFKPEPSGYAGYGDSQQSNRPNYSSPAYVDGGYSKPTHVEKPSYSNQNSYGSNHGSYSSSEHGTNPEIYTGNEYTTKKPLNQYKPNRGNYQMPSSNSYGGSQNSFDSNQGTYGSNQSSQSSSYGSELSYNKPYMHSHDPSYGHGGSSYEQSKPSYDRPSYGSKPNIGQSYDYEKPAYGAGESIYTPEKPIYGVGYKPSYQNKPTYDQTGHEDNKPGYEPYKFSTKKPSYGSVQDTYGDSLATNGESQYYGSSHNSYGPSEFLYNSYRPTLDLYGYMAINTKPTYNRPGSNPHNKKPKPHGQPAVSNQGYANANRPEYDESRPDFADNIEPGYGESDFGYGDEKPNKTGVKPVYEYELDKPSNVPSYIARPGGEVVTSRPMSVGDYGESDNGRQHTKPASYEGRRQPLVDKSFHQGSTQDPSLREIACFRRVLPGKRALRSHVRKVAPCERLEDCKRECATEKRFACESFNYRIDRSFRGKGLCELMTKPIEAFNLRRDFIEDKDFDFYERDRNSLEPNCPDRLRGQGLLHSGFLSSKPNRIPERESGWRDRYAPWGEERHRDRFGDRDGYNGHNNRLYIPYQINQGISRSGDDDIWGQYGGDYGGTERYYKDRNDYHKSVSHWRIRNDIEKPSYGVKPFSNINFNYNSLGRSGEGPERYGYGSWKRGRWNNLGNDNTLEYGEANFYKPKSHFHGVNEHGHDPIARSDEGPPKDCSSRRRPGMSLGSGAIRRALHTRNVVECEAACFTEREFKCVSYSFRYSSSHGTDNCFLSERPYRGLELSADSSSDVYAMPQDQGCATINYTPWVESECFWHVRSGAVVSDSAVRAALTVAGLGACEAECIRAHDFFCRGFSFRFDSPTIGDDIENCILTSSPPTSLDTGRGLLPNSGHELYARGNYGRGCEPALYDNSQLNRDDECYLQYEKAARLTGGAIRGQARVKDEQSCGRACNEAPFTCLSFSFNNKVPPSVDNCLLSEIRLFDLKRGVDYIHSEDDWLFAFDLFNGQCWRKVHAHHHDDSSPEVPKPLSAPPIEDPYSPSGPSGPPGVSGPSGPSGPDYPSDHHDPTYIPSGPPSGLGYKPDPPSYPPSSESGYIPDRPGQKPHYPPRPSNKPGYPAPSGPDFKPGYPGPSFEPDYPEPSGPGFKPGYPIYKPGYSEPHGPGFEPGYPGPNLKPEYSEPSGPDFKPGYPGPIYKPSYTDPSGPDYKPAYPGSGPNYKPGYPGPESNYKPVYPSDDKFILKPGYSDLDSNFKPAYPPPLKPEYGVRPNYKPGYLPDSVLKPGFRPIGHQRPPYRPIEQEYIPGKPSYLPEKPPYRPDNRPGYPGPNRPFTDGTKPGRLPGRPFPDREISEPISSWRHYTVSGFPCRTGTTCAQNHVAGHWACEPEGGEIGSWDYCCAPTHRCGYSEGFHKPWCYVGPSEDQWRPCSEKYYPYHHHKVPHPSQGHQQSPGYNEPEPTPQRPWNRPSPPAGPPLYNDRPQGPPRPPQYDRPQGPYLSEADRRYWDELYKNGPQAYYDKYGNPLPGYSRVPTEERPHIKYSHNYPRPSSGQWQQLPQETPDRPPPALGVPRYWPVAYLHKGPPPNTTYFRYNETHQTTTTENTHQDTTTQREQQSTTTPPPINIEKHRDEKQRNISVVEETVTQETTTIKLKPTTTEISIVDEVKENKTEIEKFKPVNVKVKDNIKGIDDKLDDFSGSIEVFDLDDAKVDKPSALKTLEAEERQIEEIGRILASRRGGKLVIDKREQKDLETKSIAVDKELTDFNFGNRFSTERRGIIQKVTKDEIERERAADKSLEVSETAFVRPPRVLSTTDNIRKAIINGKVFYDATIRDQRETFLSNSTRRGKSLRNADDSKLSNLTTVANFGKKIILARNVNPVRRVRRVYKKRYNPDEVRRRLLEREKSKHENAADSSKLTTVSR